MSLEADSLAERRRLKRRLRFWRIGAILLAVLAIFAVFASRNEGLMAQFGINPHVTRVAIEGFISDSREIAMSQEYIALLGRQRGLEFECFSSEQGAIIWLTRP